MAVEDDKIGFPVRHEAADPIFQPERDCPAERAEVEGAAVVQQSRGGHKCPGSAPLGWYTGRSSENTRRLVEHGGFLYDADSCSNDLPYWERVAGKPHLVVSYTLDTNDMRFATAQGFNSGDQFFGYLKDAFDTL